ncbi:hypothetical protein BK718_01185 [Bacillus thuringiensis serovar andalousiensis]|uniref:Uncharacterized protein n=1 Tax=Bacillus thuringiensis TaxID=1428 RepID=A0A9X6KE04_BACTU|nr:MULTISPECIES: hypothetical protein [Bacillus cereus group]MDA2611356.1 hypothetical protein [Bacillus cereus]MEB8554787.1 hypothetical protein [Bacillus cereus]MEB8725295.1 hypothetical protein [Bacillus cereus]MEB8820204.1 hypothetical protein [Bacillus cereus]MEB8972307.1 hypothetical protein [Bacillus cereus]
MEKITVNFHYQDVGESKELQYEAYLLSDSVYYEFDGENLTFREIPLCERGKKELIIYDSDSYRAVEIRCKAEIENIHEMSAGKFIEAVLKGQN